ncbi:hypothetical protein G3496_19740 [Shewanella baltica]|uniref:Abi family protein n=1 Tax=Shewanella baltica TaxID=62322 RepID=UPI00217F16F9|nr:Abi family protein [Shewanella baltica]MCS6137137.1 hypothetical protein [Shewanella baltica]
MQPINIQQTHIDISLARLSSYRAMFHGANDHELYGIYCWNEALSATLFRLISITEVVMRNRFHTALSLHLHNRNSVGRKGSNDWYSNIALTSKSAEKIRAETHFYHKNSKTWRPKKPQPSANDVVSRMTYGFWPKLLDVSGIAWGQLLPQIVPGHRYKDSTYWSVTKHQDALYARLDLVNRIRNRIAHFEPVWKQGALYEERRERHGSPKPSIELYAPRSPAEVILRLKLIHNRITELLKWLSPDRYSDYMTSYVESHFNWVCSDEGLTAYKQMQPRVSMPMSRFKRDLNGILTRQVMVTVSSKSSPVGTYYPIPR